MRVHRVLITALIVASLLESAPQAAQAVELVTGSAYLPYADEHAPGGGLATELMAEIFRRIGDPAHISFMPWKRGYSEAEAGNYAGTFPYVWTVERNKAFLYSAPLLELRQMVYVAHGHPIPLGVNDMKGLSLCLPLGYAASPIVQPEIDAGRISVIEPADLASCFRLLSAGRADFVTGDEPLLKGLLGTAGLDRAAYDAAPTPIGMSSLHFIVSRKLPEAELIIERVNQMLEAMRADGSYAKLLSKYIS